MILRTLKSNQAVNLILFSLFGILLWIKNILKPVSYNFYFGENSNFLFSPVVKIASQHKFWQVFVALLLVIFIAFIILQVNDRYSLIRARTKLPATIFILVIGGFTDLHILHPVYFAAVFLMFAIHSFFSIFNNPNTLPGIFNAGFFLGIGTLFYFNLFIVVPAFLIGVIILCRELHWREFVILLIGFVVPIIFALGIAFYTDRLLELLYTFQQNVITPVNHFKSNPALQGFLAVLLIITILASIKILQQYDSRKVSTRKYYTILLIIFVFTLIDFAFIPATSQEMLVISFIPVTFLISNFFVSLQNRFWSEFLFILFVLFVIFMQFSDYLI